MSQRKFDSELGAKSSKSLHKTEFIDFPEAFDSSQHGYIHKYTLGSWNQYDHNKVEELDFEANYSMKFNEVTKDILEKDVEIEQKTDLEFGNTQEVDEAGKGEKEEGELYTDVKMEDVKLDVHSAAFVPKSKAISLSLDAPPFVFNKK